MKELDLQLIVDAHLREERKERKERRGWYVSELGQCQRGVYLQRLEGAPEPDARKLRLFAVGYVFQEWLVDKVKRAGCEVETEVRVEAPDLHVSGRADLLIKGEDRTLLYEIKTMNSQGFHWRERSGNLALPHHELQVMTYLWLLREKYPNLEARLCYVSKDDLAVLSVDVPYREERVARIKEELEVMNRAWETGMPPPPAPAVVFDAERGSWTVN
jgi:CRISPR/Cas system-associated exonuclease Cas4 (RecB family)